MARSNSWRRTAISAGRASMRPISSSTALCRSVSVLRCVAAPVLRSSQTRAS